MRWKRDWPEKWFAVLPVKLYDTGETAWLEWVWMTPDPLTDSLRLFWSVRPTPHESGVGFRT